MEGADLVPLKCRPAALQALAAELVSYGAVEGEPDWLVSAVWLCTKTAHYVASSSAEVLADGYIARPLNIDTPAELASSVDASLADLQGRLLSRGFDHPLPSGTNGMAAPMSLEEWPTEPYSTQVVLRLASRASSGHRLACGLLFDSTSGRALLVGTDPSTLAMVLTDNSGMIQRYCEGCERLTVDEYRRLCSD